MRVEEVSAGRQVQSRDHDSENRSFDTASPKDGPSLLDKIITINLAVYRVLIAIAVVLAGYGGVVAHLLSIGHLEQYQSVWTWASAIGGNSFD